MLTRFRAGFGLAVAHLRHYAVRTLLVVVAVALAVLSTTLLASVGVGVVEAGTETLDAANRDVWISGGPTRITPGGVENAIVDSHAVAAEIERREDVRGAVPMAFQTVYVGTDPSDLETVVGVGVPGGGPAVSVVEGSGFRSEDVHYADGSYDGPMTHEVIVDPRTASTFDVSVGDTIHVGGTVASARENEFQVVGISPTFSRFLGAPTLTAHLSEFQSVTGTTGSDRAAQIVVTVEDGADPEAVARDLERSYPDYQVRTNREQLRAVLRGQALLLASAGVLVVLAVLTGLALTVNVLALLVHHQRRALAALKAGGVSSWTLGWVVVWQGVLVAVAGAAVGLAATPVGAEALNLLAVRLVGFEDLVRTPRWVYLLGGGLAVGIGIVGAAVAAWRTAAIRPLSELGA